MGARGPAPTPTKILKARGSWRGELNPREPRPEPGAPLCPKGFGKAEREVWRRVCRTLADMGLLTKADWAQLERYCRYLVRWRGCEEFIAQHGLTAPVISTDPASDHIETLPDGRRVVRFETFAQVGESLRLDKALKQLEANFGLSPSARTRIWANEEQGPKLHGRGGDDGKAAKFFGGRS